MPHDAPPQDLDLYPFWTEEKLRNADTDRQGHVNNAVFATFFEAGRIEVLGDSRIAAITASTSIVVVRLLIDYKKELFFPGRVRIGTRTAKVGRTSFQFEQSLQSADGEHGHGDASAGLGDGGSGRGEFHTVDRNRRNAAARARVGDGRI